ncbi:MAG: N-6 DNA methylase, partial [Anaerolineae bacterium]|uniref:DNA methyltransferase n=1 Tax=Thermoflexus sp. TaxID=1969742 RepID=UPI0025FAD837
VTADPNGQPRFVLGEGSERRTTGSYYTPPALVAELVQRVLGDQLRGEGQRKESHDAQQAASRRLLSLRILDPACGSGHFLLAAARTLGMTLARLRSGEDEPAPEQARQATRDVIRHCIYGVDKNPLAVELCKVALWIESHEPDKPLTFLDHRIRCGDSLVGVLDLNVLDQGIPENAFERVEGDDPRIVNSVRRENRLGQRGARALPAILAGAAQTKQALAKLAQRARAIENLPDDTPADIQRKAAQFETLEAEARRLRVACNL